MKPSWYVVQYAASPPAAAPISIAAIKEAYCSRLKAEKRAFVVYDAAESSAAELCLLEALMCVSADMRMRALIALNRARIDHEEWLFSFWECSNCDGALVQPTACGCCQRPDCAVRCGCRCPSEFACCDGCGSRVPDCTCFDNYDVPADLRDDDEPREPGTLENCNSCSGEFRSYGSPWCDGCIAMDEERKCAGC